MIYKYNLNNIMIWELIVIGEIGSHNLNN